MDSVSVKLPEKADELARQLQATYMLRRKKNISKGQVITDALSFALENVDAVVGVKKSKKDSSIMSIVGMIRGGPKTDSGKEVDAVVYGV